MKSFDFRKYGVFCLTALLVTGGFFVSFGVVTAATLPAPTASLTVNGSHSATFIAGDTVAYAWASTNADKFTSSYASKCGNGAWIANSSKGTLNSVIAVAQTGCTYTITYTVTQSATGVKVSDVITLNVVAPALKTITISPLSTSLTVTKKTQQLTATTLNQSGRAIAAKLVWTSDNTAVATVSATGLVTGIVSGMAKISASSGSITSSAPAVVTVTIPPPVVKTITISPLTTTLSIGSYHHDTSQLKATTIDQYGKPIVTTLVWTSSDPTIVAVDSKGNFGAVGIGTAKITASSSGVTSAPSVITVNYNAGYPLKTQTNVVPTEGDYVFSGSASTTLFLASGGSFSSYVRDGKTKVMFDPNITAYGISYSVGYEMLVNKGEFHYQNGSVVGFPAADSSNSNNYPTDGFRITGHFDTPTSASGSVSYIFSGAVWKTVNFTAVLKPMPPVLKTISVAPLTVNLTAGSSTKQLLSTTLDQYSQPIVAPLTWASDNTAVVTVSSSGLVTPVGAGTANITASSGSITSAPVVITVAPSPQVLKTITISPLTTELTVTGKQTQQLTATTLDQNGKPMPATLTWESANPYTVSVDSNGLATLVNYGTTTITASSGAITSNAAVIVVKYAFIKISPQNMFIAYSGETQQLTATLLDEKDNPIPATFAWASNNSQVATVSATGLVTAVAHGTAYITASVGNFSNNIVIVVGRNTPGYTLKSQTGVVPQIGNYSFLLTGYGILPFSVSGTSTSRVITFSSDGYAQYRMTVNNGEFHYQNGYYNNPADDSNTNMYPTDGFVLAGHFDTPTSASGTYNDKNFTASTTASIPTLKTISISPATVSLTLATSTKQLTAITLDQNGNPMSASLTWVSDNTAVATVSATGLVTGIVSGMAKISASSGNVTSNMSVVTVTHPIVQTNYSYTKVNVGNTVEHQIFLGQQHFLTIIIDQNGGVAIRPHPGLDVNGWGSSLYLEPFLPGAVLRGTTIQSVDVATSGVKVAVGGVVSQGSSGSYGTWNENLNFSYDSAQKDITGSGTYNIGLTGALGNSTGDLNLYKLASNYLVGVPLLDGTTGDTGDMKSATVTGGTSSDFTWIPKTGTTFPGEYRNPISIDVAGDYNQVDTVAQGYDPIAAAYKPSMKVVLSSTQNGLPLIFGGMYDSSQSKQFWSDNVGITPLILKSATSTNYSFNVSFDSKAIAGDH